MIGALGRLDPNKRDRPGHRGGRAAAGRPVQAPGDRPRRGPGAPGGAAVRPAWPSTSSSAATRPTRRRCCRPSTCTWPPRCRRPSGCRCWRRWPAGCRCCTPPARRWTGSRPTAPARWPGTSRAARRDPQGGRGRRAAPAAGHRGLRPYGIESVAARIDDLYERQAARRRRRLRRWPRPSMITATQFRTSGARPLRWISLWRPRAPIRTSSAGSACGVTSSSGACPSTTSSWSR